LASAIILQTAGLIVLIVASAFFSMSETALISVDRSHVRDRARAADVAARRIERLLADWDRVLATILLGNNLVNIAASALATLIAINLIGNTGAAVATGVMTFVLLTFAEITPKTLAVRRSYAVAAFVAPFLGPVHKVLSPFVIVLYGIARGILRLFGVRTDKALPYVTTAKIAQLVRMGVEEGEVEKFEERIISEVFDFTETPVRTIMTPKDKVRFLQPQARLIDALEMTGRTGHSRLPVAEGDFDHILGFVHAKDLLKFSDPELHEKSVIQVLRPVLFTPGSTRSDHVLARMQREHKLLAVVHEDEHNVGIATVEDLLEELVGEIHDEFDRPRSEVRAEDAH
jgi:putative hemolysin